MGCTFCNIYQNKVNIVSEKEYFFIQFDKFPVSPGHSEVVTKRHVASLFDLTQEEWRELQPTFSDLAKVIEQTDFKEVYQNYIDNPLNGKSIEFCQKMLGHIGISKKPDAYTIGINEGEAAGRTINHLHIHLIPRFFGDVEDYMGGVRHIIPGMGNYKR